MFGERANYYYEQKAYEFLDLEKFDLEAIINKYPFYLGINPFDIYVLEKFIENFQIKSAVELGCGSSSIILDSLGVQRQSYAQGIPNEEEIEFNEVDLHLTMGDIQDEVKSVDLLFIDCEHSAPFAKKYTEILLPTFEGLVFIHDWYLPDEESWDEQRYLLEVDLLSNYRDSFITRHFCKTCEGTNIPPCSIFLWSRI